MSNRVTSAKGRVANLLAALACEVSDRLQRLLQQHPNQTDSASAALNVIAGGKGLSNSALSQVLQLSHPATVRLVAKLKDDGLVEIGDAADKRAIAIRITPAGRQKIRSLLDERGRALNELVNVLSSSEQQQLEKLVAKMLTSLAAEASHGHYICRLCDHDLCPPPRCPVNLACQHLSL
jgi:MarR family transcriptional regulator, negative regulator of the multidrug operon emrRAB